MGQLTRVLEKAGYTIDLSGFEEPEVVFELVEEKPVPDPGKEAEKKQSQEKARNDTLPEAGKAGDLPSAVLDDLESELIEPFEILLSNVLQSAKGGTKPRSLLITSVFPGEGKSFIAANLGKACAGSADQQCIVVDCDFRQSTLVKDFGAENLHGVADYLAGEENLESLVQRSSIAKMSILASGIPHLEPGELLGSVRMHDLVEELRSTYPDHWLIFDTPALQAVPESIVLCHAIDDVVLVVHQGGSSKAAVEKAVYDIGADKILGIIDNGDEADYHKPRFVSTDDYSG